MTGVGKGHGLCLSRVLLVFGGVSCLLVGSVFNATDIWGLFVVLPEYYREHRVGGMGLLLFTVGAIAIHLSVEPGTPSTRGT
jgi:hypothetical protein